jgi:hypothetical protein
MEAYPPKPPSGHHVHNPHGHGSPVNNRWRFSKFRKKFETLTLTLKIFISQENKLEQLTLVLFESLVYGLHILFYNIFGQTIYWSTTKPWTIPKKCSNDLERSKFRQQVQSFVCVPPWRRVTSKFWEVLKIASEVSLVQKNLFSLKILNFVQSFVECKVSLADSMLYSPISNTSATVPIRKKKINK